MTGEQSTPDRTGFGDVVRELRRQAGLDLQELAEATGIGVGALAALESGQDAPRPSTVELMASALQLPAPVSKALWQLAHRRWQLASGAHGHVGDQGRSW